MSASRRPWPWLIFLVGGTVAALGVHLVVPQRTTLVLDGGRVTLVLKRESELRGRPLTGAERAAAIAELEDEEILLVEARHRNHLRRGYVYSRLLKKMRMLLTEDLAVPSDAELKALYDGNRGTFRRAGTVAFEHVFFARGGAATPDDTDATLRRLQGGLDPSSLGDPHPLGTRVGLREENELAEVLGADAARRLLEVPIDTWQGPLRSDAGVHYVRITSRTDPRVLSFDEVLPSLRGAWTMDQQRDALQRRTRALMSRYRVFLEDEE